MSCCMLLLCTSWITRFQNRLSDVTRLFRTHDLFQFHMVLLGLETDPSILPCDIFWSQERHVELNDSCMRILREDP